MTDYLIIPDIHLKLSQTIRALDKFPARKVIFLGDYFDHFVEAAPDYIDLCKWLKGAIYRDDYVFLIGNHDLNYYKNNLNSDFHCSGYEWWKNQLINDRLTTQDWRRFKFYHYEAGINCLFTHAGLSKLYQKYAKNSFAELEIEARKIENLKESLFCKAGLFRGGSGVGGPLWCDIQEFSPISGLNQVFGHTPGAQVLEVETFNYCIDTSLKYCLTIEDGNPKVVEV